MSLCDRTFDVVQWCGTILSFVCLPHFKLACGIRFVFYINCLYSASRSDNDVNELFMITNPTITPEWRFTISYWSLPQLHISVTLVLDLYGIFIYFHSYIWLQLKRILRNIALTLLDTAYAATNQCVAEGLSMLSISPCI